MGLYIVGLGFVGIICLMKEQQRKAALKKRHDLGADMPISFKIRLLIWKLL